MKKVLLDTCVVLDVLQNRQPFAVVSKKIFEDIANKNYQGFLTAKSITDIYYLCHKTTHSDEVTRQIIGKLFCIFQVVDTTAEDCEQALVAGIHDYEDAVMTKTALRIGADVIITRNVKDFVDAKIDVCSPEKFLEKLKNYD